MVHDGLFWFLELQECSYVVNQLVTSFRHTRSVGVGLYEPHDHPPLQAFYLTLYILNHMSCSDSLLGWYVEAWCNTYHKTRTIHSIPVVFSESEFYCILVSPVIICRFKVL